MSRKYFQSTVFSFLLLTSCATQKLVGPSELLVDGGSCGGWKVMAPSILQRVTLSGTGTNVTANLTTGVSMVINSEGDGSLRAVGAYDSINLFGRFNMPGKLLGNCRGLEAYCMQFEGDFLLGDDGSGYPSGTRKKYVMTSRFMDEEQSASTI